MKIIKAIIVQPVTSISDSELLAQIRSNAASERAFGLAVIQQLREIARRRLDAKLGYPSLHRFCMEELKYSSGGGSRRWRRSKICLNWRRKSRRAT